jgi:hypothetical protein
VRKTVVPSEFALGSGEGSARCGGVRPKLNYLFWGGFFNWYYGYGARCGEMALLFSGLIFLIPLRGTRPRTSGILRGQPRVD